MKWGEGKGTAGEEGIRFGVEGQSEDKKGRPGRVRGVYRKRNEKAEKRIRVGQLNEMKW